MCKYLVGEERKLAFKPHQEQGLHGLVSRILILIELKSVIYYLIYMPQKNISLLQCHVAKLQSSSKSDL